MTYTVSLSHTQYVVDKLFWPVTPLLESVGQHEPHTHHLRTRVDTAIIQSLIPLMAYAKQYEQYLDLINLDIKSYIEYVCIQYTLNIYTYVYTYMMYA